MTDEYWHAVKVGGMRVPPDLSLDDATVELVGMLAHPDPRRREDLGAAVLTTWIARGVYDDLLAGLGDGVLAGLGHGLGRESDPTVLRRATSAQILAEVILRDTRAQTVDSATTLTWGDAITDWFVRERDHRGWTEEFGWVHIIAHGADAIGALARSRHLSGPELAILLDVVAERVLAPTEHVWRHGEDDRLALAAMTLLHRGEIPRAHVESWIARLGAGLHAPRRRGHADIGWPTATARNTSAVLRALHLQLALGVRGRPDLPDDARLFAQIPVDRADFILAILDEIRAESAWLFRVPQTS